MIQYLRTFCTILMLSLTYCLNIHAEWEIIQPGVDIRDLKVIGNTWFARNQNINYGGYLVYTSDKGFDWDTIPGMRLVDDLAINGERIVVKGTYNNQWGYYMSKDRGQSWKKLKWTLTGGQDLMLTDSAIFITISKNPNVESPLYRSLDDGETFLPMNIDTEGKPYIFSKTFGNICRHKNDLAIFVGRVGFFISHDEGNTWTKQNTGLPITEANYSDFTMGTVSSSPLGITLFLHNTMGIYKLNNGNWNSYDYQIYSYDSNSKKYQEQSKVPMIINASRSPYLFANGDYYQTPYQSYLFYSIDNGEKWFFFSNSVSNNATWDAVLIDGNYVYAGSRASGFGRRKLSEAINPLLNQAEEKKINKIPISPEQMKLLLTVAGTGAYDEILEDMGYDSDDISEKEMDDFLNDYTGEASSDLFGKSQPGMCSLMGMPSWSMNLANLKLFVRDLIFRKKGLGPEVKLAMNYIRSADSAEGIFGKFWRFEYESVLEVKDSAVILKTGSGATFLFTENNPIITGAAPFTLHCAENDNYKLDWTGSFWQVEKGHGYEYMNFTPVSSGIFILESIQDGCSKKLQLAYNAEKKPVSLTDASGRIYRITYNKGLCDSIVAPDKRCATFSYDNRNLLTSATDFDKIITYYTYDNLRNITTANISGKITSFNYNYTADSLGQITSVTDPENRVTEYTPIVIDSANWYITITNPGNDVSTYRFNNGLVESISSNNNETKEIFYNQAGYVDSLIWYDGTTVSFTYDTNHNIIARKDRFGKTTNYHYDSNRNLLREENDLGETLYTNTYNTKNQLTSTTPIRGSVTSYEYDTNGALAAIINSGGDRWSFTRDAYGNIVSFSNPAGNNMSFEYNINGMQPKAQTDFAGNKYDLSYDNNGRLNQITMPDGTSKFLNYDCCVQNGITDQNGNIVSVARDATNRILERFYPEGWSIKTDYDQNGFVSGFTNKFGKKVRLDYNDRGKLKSVTDEEGTIKYGYDVAGRKTSITDKKGNITIFSYNQAGKLSEMTDALGNKSQFSYDQHGRMSSTTNSRQQTTEIIYNEKGEPTEKKVNSASLSTYQYDADGDLKAFTDSAGTTSYIRDKFGFVSTITYPGNLTVTFTHDANGNITGMTYPNGLVVSSQVSSMNRITNLSWGNSSVAFDYDATGNLLTETRNNNTQTRFSYNKDNSLVSVSHYRGGTYFAGETVTMEAGIITSVSTLSIPPISKRPTILTDATTNSLNQIYQTSNGYYYTYDADGNMICAYKNWIAKVKASYTHDNLINTLITDAQSVKITYDGMRYPRKVVTNGVSAYLYYDHKGRLLFETDDSGNVTRNYIYRGKRLIACQTADNIVYFYHYNRLGCTLAMTGSNGNTVNSYVYGSNGEIIGKSESAANRFTFLGAFGGLRLDDDYCLTGARVYSAPLARYIQKDPLGMLTGTNQYLYANNNPVMSIDPLGFADTEATVNTLNFDPPSDNDYGTAAGTSNPYEEGLKYRDNAWDTYGSATINTVNDFSNHPISDFLPAKYADPMTHFKAIDNLSNGDIGGALWQYVPFNNSLEAVGDYINEKMKYTDPPQTNGLGLFPNFDHQKTTTCDL